jgi:LPXTG-site transpeptidase (sortase) family protein
MRRAGLWLAAFVGWLALRSPTNFAPIVASPPPQPAALVVTSEKGGWVGDLFAATAIPPTATLPPTPVLVVLPIAFAPPDSEVEQPTATNTPHGSGCPTYVVKAGDGLPNIAEVFGVSFADLLSANLPAGETSLTLQAGQVLIIPRDGCWQPTPTPSPRPTRIPVTDVPYIAPATNPPPSDQASIGSPFSGPPLQGNLNISIPALAINLPVINAKFTGNTWDFAPVVNTAALLEGLALPGMAGNVVIGAHYELSKRRPGPFYSLKQINAGDEIVLNYNGASFRYIVERTWYVPPTDITPIDQQIGDVLTLLTCDSYNSSTGGYDLRLIVRAVRAG